MIPKGYFDDSLGEASRQAIGSLQLLFKGIERSNMPNANYLAGRRFEYERMAHYRELDHVVMRTAGSHGLFDLISIDVRHGLATLIQCKVVDNLASAKRLLHKFRGNPPLGVCFASIHQRLEVKVKGSKEVHSVTI